MAEEDIKFRRKWYAGSCTRGPRKGQDFFHHAPFMKVAIVDDNPLLVPSIEKENETVSVKYGEYRHSGGPFNPRGCWLWKEPDGV